MDLNVNPRNRRTKADEIVDEDEVSDRSPDESGVEKDLPSESEDESDSDLAPADDIGAETDAADAAERQIAEQGPPEIKDQADDLIGQLSKEKDDKADEGRAPASEDDELSDDELTSEAPAQAQAPSHQNPQLSKYQDYLNQYQQLTGQRRKMELMNALTQAGSKIGQSMAGRYSGQFVPDPSQERVLEGLANRPVTDFEQGMAVQGGGLKLAGEINSADPNSPQSAMVRDYLNKRLGMNLGPDVSAADAQMLMKAVGRPIQTKFQKVNGTWTDPSTGESRRMSAVFNPATGAYQDSETGKSLPGFLAEGLNPFQSIINPNTGEREVFNKSRGGASAPVPTGQAPVGQATNPQEVNASLTPVTRKELNDKVVPAFNKETEKIQQRLNHVPVILQRLEEAQQNPAALPQLKAELARFDVGDQRLAQQELEMFAKRQGYKGWGDLLQAKTQGTISSDFANDMRQAISHVSDNLHDQLSQAAEKHAKILSSRLPPGQKVTPQTIAPLIYGDYKPSKAPQGDMVQVTSAKTGKVFMLPKDKVQQALDNKLIQPLSQ